MNFLTILLISGLGVPWGFDFLDNNTMIVTERRGVLSTIDLKTKKKTTISGLPKIHESGQGGLLDVKKHPSYPKEPWVYITYSEKVKDGATTSLARFQLQKNKIVKFKRLFQGISNSDTSRHFGSRIAFDEKGYVFFSIGDRGVRKNGQDRSTHAGSIMRLHLDGRVPKDNPFVGKKGVQPEIWSYGHRNPQGLAFDQKTKKLWSIEHGPRGGDEINLIKKGKNYGWPTISYGKEYWGPVAVGEGTHRKDMEQPVHYYVPSIAPCGLMIYRGNAFPQWRGNLFSGALKLTHLNRVVLNGDKFVKEDRLLKDKTRRVRNVQEGSDGLIYFSTDRGEIFVIKPKKG